MSRDEYESELTGSREEIAAALSDVEDGILSGSLRLGDDADAVTVDPPEELSLEIELETEGDEVSLELEVEWTAPDGESAVSPAGDRPEAAPEDENDVQSPVGAADESQSLARFEVFRDRAGQWRWRLRHRNGNVIADSGEGYTQKHNAWNGLQSVMENAPEAEITDESRD